MNSKLSPTVFGVQNPGRSPSGTKIAPKRRVGFGAAAVLAIAVIAGTIDSSSGSASVTPIPRRKVRLGNDILVMNMAASSLLGPAQPPATRALTSGGPDRRVVTFLSHLDPLLKGRAVDDALHNRRELVIVRRAATDDRAHRGHVVIRETAAERVGQQLLGHRADEDLRVAHQRLPQRHHAIDLRAVEEFA